MKLSRGSLVLMVVVLLVLVSGIVFMASQKFSMSSSDDARSKTSAAYTSNDEMSIG